MCRNRQARLRKETHDTGSDWEPHLRETKDVRRKEGTYLELADLSKLLCRVLLYNRQPLAVLCTNLSGGRFVRMQCTIIAIEIDQKNLKKAGGRGYSV
jgi:hypothetical protein